MGGRPAYSQRNRHKQQDRRKTRSRCSRFRKKKVYLNPECAEEAAADMQARYRQTFQAYPCDRCRCWHVGRPHPGEEREPRPIFDPPERPSRRDRRIS